MIKIISIDRAPTEPVASESDLAGESSALPGNFFDEGFDGIHTKETDAEYDGMAYYDAGEPESDLIKITVFDGDKEIKKNDFAFITAEPKMPEIKVKAEFDTNRFSQIWIRLKIKYNNGYKRDNIDFFPIEEEKQKYFLRMESNQIVSIDFGDKFRGGDAYIEVYTADKNDNLLKNMKLVSSFSFYIRGLNPKKEIVKSYINAKGYFSLYWFIYKIIISETDNEGWPICQQFFEPQKKREKKLVSVKKIKAGKEKIVKEYQIVETDKCKYGVIGKGVESAGMPYWKKAEGDGWGMAQIDWAANTKGPKTAPPQVIWNWKANVDALKEELDSKREAQVISLKKEIDFLSKKKVEKKDIIFPEDQLEGIITYENAKTSMQGYDDINKWMGEKQTGDMIKSFLDADLIKRYNGGRYLSFDREKKEWSINRKNNLGFNYVERVSNINE